MGKSFPGRLYLIPVLSKALDVLELMQKENSPDRKSTRLNSSHLVISYAVFCLKKKKTDTNNIALARAHHDSKTVTPSLEISTHRSLYFPGRCIILDNGSAHAIVERVVDLLLLA